MCEGGHPPQRAPKSFVKLAFQPGVPLGERLRGIGVNLSRRFRDRQLNDCCGRYGEPGC